MRVERTRTLRPPASPDAGVRPSTQPHHHGCRGGAMNQTTQALEHASVRQYCKVLRMPVIGSNFVWLSEQAIKEQRSHIGISKHYWRWRRKSAIVTPFRSASAMPSYPG